MKKVLACVVVLMSVGSALAWPHHHHYHHYHHHHGGYGWAAVGTGFAAGVVGAALYNAVAPRETVVVQQPAPVVVQQPVAQARPEVWVDGRYIDQVQPNGAVVRVWQPGHYE